jgi:hypothetical protein
MSGYRKIGADQGPDQLPITFQSRILVEFIEAAVEI